MSDPRSEQIFLVGFMGSGKSSIGKRLAARMQWTFEDTDQLVEKRDGRSIARIFDESGEPHFRRLEEAALHSLRARRKCVVATGAGLFSRPENRAWIMARGFTVWLEIPFDTACRRLGSRQDRPLWNADDPVGARRLYDRRRRDYSTADGRVDASEDDPDRVAAAVETLFFQNFR